MSHEPWFDEECLKLVDRKKQAKLLWLQDPSVVKEDTCCNVRREASRHFRKKKREYLKDKITEIELNSKNENIKDLYRGITEFEKGYQPRTNLVMDERVDLAEPQIILTRWKNYFCQLLNVHGPGSIRQTEIHTTVPFVTEPSAAEVEITIRELKRYSLQNQVLIRFQQNCVKHGGKKCVLICINLLCWYGTKKYFLTSGKSQWLYLFT
jgi:hypothetical protein